MDVKPKVEERLLLKLWFVQGIGISLDSHEESMDQHFVLGEGFCQIEGITTFTICLVNTYLDL